MSEAPPLFTPFTWFRDPATSDEKNFVSDVRDIAFGLVTLLQLLENDTLAKMSGELPILSDFDAAQLRRLSIVSARLIGESASRQIDSINDPKV